MTTLLLDSLLRGCVRLDVPALGLGVVAFGTYEPRNPTSPAVPMAAKPDAEPAASGAGRPLRSSGIRVQRTASV